jgi:hypothetical protein
MTYGPFTHRRVLWCFHRCFCQVIISTSKRSSHTRPACADRGVYPASTTCPTCHGESQRIPGRYTRALTDVPSARRVLTIYLRVRRFVGLTAHCPRTTFAGSVGRQRQARDRTIQQRFCADTGRSRMVRVYRLCTY